MTIDLTEQQKRTVWDVLVDACGARPEQWADFNYHFPQCREYRFQGTLGFGGKVYADARRVRVSCYSEDRTPERDALIELANAALAVFRHDD